VGFVLYQLHARRVFFKEARMQNVHTQLCVLRDGGQHGRPQGGRRGKENKIKLAPWEIKISHE